MPRLAQAGPAGAALQVNDLIARAVVEMFSYDAVRLRAADALLERAARLLPTGRVHAWRSLVRQIMFVERTEGPPKRLESEADAFARDALDRSNGNPLVGVPFISTNAGCVSEFPGGLIRKCGPETTKAIQEVLNNDDLRRILGAEGRAACETKYDWERVLDAYEKLFKMLVAKKP